LVFKADILFLPEDGTLVPKHFGNHIVANVRLVGVTDGALRNCTSVCSEEIQGDLKKWTQFRPSIFPELFMVCE